MSLAIALLDKLLEEARKGGLQTVTRATVELGALQSIEPDLLREAFQAAAEGTAAQGAALELTTVPAEGRCLACGHSFQPSYRDYSCPACGKADIKVEAGRSMYLLSLSGESDA